MSCVNKFAHCCLSSTQQNWCMPRARQKAHNKGTTFGKDEKSTPQRKALCKRWGNVSLASTTYDKEMVLPCLCTWQTIYIPFISCHFSYRWIFQTILNVCRVPCVCGNPLYIMFSHHLLQFSYVFKIFDEFPLYIWFSTNLIFYYFLPPCPADAFTMSFFLSSLFSASLSCHFSPTSGFLANIQQLYTILEGDGTLHFLTICVTLVL